MAGLFTEASPAAWALAAGENLKSIDDVMQITANNYKLSQVNGVAEFKAAEVNAQASQNFYNDQASATRKNAYGELAMGSFQIGGEIASFGLSAYYDNQISKMQEGSDNIGTWQDSLENAKAARVKAGKSSDADDITETDFQKLVNGGKKGLESRYAQFKPSLEEEQHMEALQANGEKYDRFSKNLEKNKKQADNAIQRLESIKNDKKQTWNNTSRSIGTMTQGTLSLLAAKDVINQGVDSVAQIMSQTSLEVIKQIQQSVLSVVDSLKSTFLDMTHSLLAGLADSNKM